MVSTYNEYSNLTSRRNALTGAATEYTWGRLVCVVERGSDGQTKTWAYKYDALGRRLEAQYEGEKSVTINSFYDPEFEYLELGLRINDTTIWKQYGPDSSGYYGELNGIGGLEGIIHGLTGDSMGVINDVVGNVAAYTYHGEAYFLEGDVDSYGRISGDAWLDEDSEELTDNTVFWVLKNSRFRGRRVEGNGLSNFGARYYNTETGSFLSADPYGHDGSLNLYSYADADPVNYVDPDGRLSQPVNEPIGSSQPLSSVTAPQMQSAKSAPSMLRRAVNWVTKGPETPAEKAFMNFGAAAADNLTWGAASTVRSFVHKNDPIDTSSIAYKTGSYIGLKSLVTQGGRQMLGVVTPRAARRAVMREAGIPTSMQPVSQLSPKFQGRTSVGRQYTYEVAKPGGGIEIKSVQHSLTDRVPGHGPHWEAGPIKSGGRKDPFGRPRILEGVKNKVNE